MLVGYARVSTVDQTLALQQDALTTAGCQRIFTDTASGSRTERPGLDEALDFARPRDTLVVWRLGRLGRSLRHLIDTVSLLQERGIGFQSLQEQLDTTSSGGKLVFHVFGALAEFERDLIRERTQAGLLAARARGWLDGRPRALDPRKVQIVQALYHDKTNAIADICRILASPEPPSTATSRPGQGSRPDAVHRRAVCSEQAPASGAGKVAVRRCWSGYKSFVITRVLSPWSRQEARARSVIFSDGCRY